MRFNKVKPPSAPQGVIACLDVSLRNTGLAVYDQESRRFIFSEVIETEKGEGLVAYDDIACCVYLGKAIGFRLQKFNVSLVLAEVPTGGAQGARANRTMGLATGVIAGMMAQFPKVKFVPVLPSDTKRLYRDTGSVSKEDMQLLVQREFGSDCLPKQKGQREHIADAMATLLFVQRFAPHYLGK